MLYRAIVVLLATTSIFAQPSYFAARTPLTNTRYIAAAETSALAGGVRAADQTLVATASTPNAALVVWNEAGDARAGVRGLHGSWRERLVAPGERAIAAASDGDRFVVITDNEAGWAATLLDEQGAVVLRSDRSAFHARGVAVSATGYAVIGTDDAGNVVAARGDRTGFVTAPVTIRAGAEDPAIASDGSNFLAVWQTSASAVEAVRLDANLGRMDVADVVLHDYESEDPAVAFNGTQYVVAWRFRTFIRARRVSVDGTAPNELVQTGRSDGDAPRDIALTRLGDRMGFAWFDGLPQVVIFDGWTVQTARGFETHIQSAPKLVALPLDGIAFAQNDILDDAPYLGSGRILLSVAHPAPVATVPDAPHATVTQSGAKLRVDWTPPPQPVNGYRIESRLADGPWLEHEGWADSTTTSLLIDAHRSGTYEVRMRAWSDAGTGAYSDPVQITITAGRRRAVR
jgi:hypothetical protein